MRHTLHIIPYALADPDLELRGGGYLDLLALSAIFSSVISSFFTQNKGGGWGAGPAAPPPLDPPLRSLDLKSGGLWFKSSTLLLAGFVLGYPEFNSSTTLC